MSSSYIFSLSLQKRRDDFTQALKEYDIAIANFPQEYKLNPNRLNSDNKDKIQYYSNHGWSYHNKGDYDKAITWEEKR